MARYYLFAFTIGLAFSATVFAGPDAQSLMKIIRSADSSDVDRANAFEKLGDVAPQAMTDEVIATVAGSLSNPHWSHYARYTLEKIPGDKIDAVLLKALPKCKTPQKIGIANSLGARRSRMAVDTLLPLLNDSNAQLAEAAAVALSQIADAKATAAVVDAFAAAEDPARRDSLAQALLVCALRLQQDDNNATAVEIYENIFNNSKVVAPTRLGALINLLATAGDDRIALLEKLLDAKDIDIFNAAVAGARQMPASAKVTAVLARSTKKLSAKRLPPIISALGDRGDRAALDVVINAVGNKVAEVRKVALISLGQLATVDEVPLVLNSDGNSETAIAILSAIQGDGVDELLLEAAKGDNARKAAIAIAALGKLKATEAVELFFEKAKSSDAAICAAACKSLANTIEQSQFERFLNMFDQVDASQADARRKFIQVAVRRMPDRAATVAVLVKAIKAGPAANYSFLCEQLRLASGPQALNTLKRFADSDNAKLQDAATQALGKWQNVNAAPVLLELAKTNKRYGVRCLRGYIRLFRQLQLPQEKRIAMARQAMAASTRDQERCLILQSLIRITSPEALQIAVGQLATPGCKADATAAILNMSKILAAKYPKETQEAIKAALAAEKN